LRIYELSANESKAHSLSDHSLNGCWRCRPGEWGQKGRVDGLRKCVVFSEYISKQWQYKWYQ